MNKCRELGERIELFSLLCCSQCLPQALLQLTLLVAAAAATLLVAMA
jgi:hypothetical protein